MGTLIHHAIVVTDWSDDIFEVRKKAIEIFEAKKDGYGKIISEMLGSVINDRHSFFIAPDGSKEGWSDSDLAEEAREEFLNWLRKSKYFCDYVLVAFGGDLDKAHIERCGDSDLENE